MGDACCARQERGWEAVRACHEIPRNFMESPQKTPPKLGVVDTPQEKTTPKVGLPRNFQGQLGPRNFTGPIFRQNDAKRSAEVSIFTENLVPIRPGTHFPTLFATLGPKGPNDPCNRPTGTPTCSIVCGGWAARV